MIVVDTSVAIKWVIPEDAANRESDIGAALSLLDRALIAPDLMLAEFGNALWKKVRRGEIGRAQAAEALAVIPDILSFVPAAAYAARALQIALELGHPFYDCLFLAVAERQACALVTADERFSARCRGSAYAPLVFDLAARAWP